ncbi:TPA: hypothetical protein DDZ86_03320 [Candidatus Dependentiae bacterium]|nr:MAG: hypothetical protein UW09_C0003G0017 [candidate division TM6 bacterium GW2011_GWF2_43_87]HBL98647.1 hypothetical protein [Candidatus Dependentiae bacterium]
MKNKLFQNVVFLSVLCAGAVFTANASGLSQSSVSYISPVSLVADSGAMNGAEVVKNYSWRSSLLQRVRASFVGRHPFVVGGLSLGAVFVGGYFLYPIVKQWWEKCKALPSNFVFRNTARGTNSTLVYTAQVNKIKVTSAWFCQQQRAHEDFTKSFQSTTNDLQFFGVFDGHGCQDGNHLDQQTHCGAHVPQAVANSLIKELDAACAALRADATDDDVKNLVGKVFVQVNNGAITDLRDKGFTGGSTAVVALVLSDRVVIANTGDSRALVALKNGTIWISEEHKPVGTEAERINNAGGSVICGRIGGTLALSRAFGDFECTGVIANPDVTIFDPAAVSFVLLGCDGLWDTIADPKLYADTIDQRLKNGEPAADLCKDLVVKALKAPMVLHTGFHNTDDTTAHLIVLP